MKNRRQLKKSKSIEALSRRYGLMFVSPWLFGFILFMAFPIITSLVYAFSDVRMGPAGLETAFVGFKHFIYALKEDSTYTDRMLASVGNVFTALPITLALSLIMGIVLNQKFKGRLLARAVFFLPVIFATGVVLERFIAVSSGEAGGAAGQTETDISAYVQAIDFQAIFRRLQLPQDISKLMMQYLSNVFNLIWGCGIQMLLFIAGLQSIPEQLYEAAKVEGSTAWETFWYITIPMLGRVIMLVLFYTVAESFTAFGSLADSLLGKMVSNGVYDSTSAGLWLYFAVTSVIMGLIMFVYYRFCLRKWEA